MNIKLGICRPIKAQSPYVNAKINTKNDNVTPSMEVVGMRRRTIEIKRFDISFHSHRSVLASTTWNAERYPTICHKNIPTNSA